MQTWHYIREDEIERYRVLMALMPLARTPDDKKSASSLRDYSRSIERMFDSATPWISRASRRRETLRGKVKPGEIMVMLEGAESSDIPLFKDATVSRD